ncbi:MAG TPA: hypothetical protein VGN63_01275 [Flavisolibacter sp.]|jgi:hypothetical protein|nr:hypothetical protein [Flavisolibacter sp.]
MPVYYYIYAIVLLSCVFLLVRVLLLRRTSLPTRLFIKGLHAENNGDYEEAAVTYENALTEVKRTRFNGVLEKKILEKLKVLHMVIDYQNNNIYIRNNKSN